MKHFVSPRLLEGLNGEGGGGGSHVGCRLKFHYFVGCRLRTFARNFSSIDFFLKILPSKDDELVMSEM